MKRRILSIITALALCLGVLPGAAQAADEDASIYGAASYTTRLDFTNVGDAEGQTPAEGPGYQWEGDAVSGYRLTLNGITIDVPYETPVPPPFVTQARRAGIYLPTDGSVTVELIGQNSITAGDGNAIYCDGGPGITVQGTGSLTSVTSGEVITNRTDGDVVIKDVTIRADARGNGFVTRGSGNIVFDNARIYIDSQGTNAPVIYAQTGNVTIKNSIVEVSCEKHPTLVGDHAICAAKDIIIEGGSVTASTKENQCAAIAAMENLIIRGGANVTAIGSGESGGFGIYAKNTMTLSQSEIAAEGTTAAVRFNTSLTLEGIAILEPSGGKVGSSAIVNDDGSNAVSVKFGAVTLNVPTSPLACTYGDTDTLKVTLTTTPAATSTVEVFSGTAKVGEGNLNEEITIDTSGLPAGDATLTAKLPDGLGEKEFTVKVNPKPLSVTGAAAADRAYDKTNEVSITSVDLGGVKAGDTVSVNTAGLKGTITGSDAGTYSSVTLPELTLTGTSAGNYILTQPDGAVSTSVTISKASYTGNTTGGSEGRFGVTKTFDLKDLLPAGYVLGGITVSDDNGIFVDTPTVDGTVLTYKLVNEEEKVGKTGTITIPVMESTNYNSFSLTITVTVKDKFVPNLTIDPITVIYNGEPVPNTAIRGTAVSEGVSVPGAWSFAGGQELTAVADSGTKNVIFTPVDGENYAQATGDVLVTINKLTPSLTLTPSPATLPNGGTVTLALSGLPSGGSATVTCSDETITVTKGSGDTWTAELPAGGASYTFTATYAGDGNHNGATANCTVSVEKITPVLSLTASPASPLIGGGTVTLTLSGLPAGGMASVTCSGGITVTAGAGGTWTAELPNSTADYTFTASYAGNDSYHGANATCTVETKEVVILPNPPADDGSTKFQLVMENGISEVPAGLQSIETLNTLEKLEAAMKTAITHANSGVPQANTAVYDVELQISTDGGTTWTKATAGNFPANGLTVTLPYPAGTNSSYTFTVVHMFTTSDFGKTPGDIETPRVINTASGLQFTVTGLSPVSVGWTAPATTPDTPSGGNHGGGGGGSVSTYAVTVEKSEHGKVTSNRTNASNGSTVTLTVTPDSGYVLDALTVTDSRGNEIKLTAQGGNKYTFTMPSRAVTVKASFVPLPDDTQKPCDGGVDCPSRGFSDLGSVGTWYHEAVDYVLRNDLMGGYGNGLFGPNDNLSRAQFAQILFNKEGRPVVNYLLQYGDVAEGAWYTEAIRWATSRGIVGGYGNGTFGPNDNITREQLAVMLWRYAGSPAATDKELHFTDADQASGFALEALRWAVENGIINGYGDGQLAPQGLATRGQVAQMLMNFLKNR